jgi:U3 small nucleolar RNA-associated protein 22
MLEDSSVDSFAEVLLRDHTLPIGMFDDFFQYVQLSRQEGILTLRIDTTDIKIPEDLHSRSELLDESDRLVQYISPILRKALSDRIHLLHLAPSTSGLTIGMVYNPSHATRVLDVGPATNQVAEVEAFRKLWGDKAELRRFKDGSIAESIVWDIARPEEASRIPGRIVHHILARHAGLSEVDIKSLSSDQAWSSIIQIPQSAREGIAVNGAEKLGFRPIMDSYDELYKLLKDVDDELPLAILNVSPVTEMLRYSAPFIPHPIDLERFASAPACLQYIPSGEITVQFESSPRWPDDLSAIQKVKMALFDKLASLIESKLRGSKARIVFDSSYSEIEDHVSLEVLLPKGVSFRLRIFHEKEKVLLERSLEDTKPAFGTALPTPPRRLILPAIEKHMYRFIHAPKHHHGLAPLHHKYPSFSTATRLVKRWFAAHMLSLLVTNEALELLVAATYLDSGPLSAPASGTTGFIRTIQKLADWEWRSEPVLVPLFADRESGTTRPRFDIELRKIAVEAFEKRSAGEQRAWCIATEDDLEGYRWTKGISRVIAGRIGALARATISALGESVTLAQGVNVSVSPVSAARRLLIDSHYSRLH